MNDINILIFGDSITYGAGDKDKCYLNNKIIDFDKELKDICLENNVDYLYVYNLLEVDDLFDGLLPNNVGHQKICDKVKTKINKFF